MSTRHLRIRPKILRGLCPPPEKYWRAPPFLSLCVASAELEHMPLSHDKLGVLVSKLTPLLGCYIIQCKLLMTFISDLWCWCHSIVFKWVIMKVMT